MSEQVNTCEYFCPVEGVKLFCCITKKNTKQFTRLNPPEVFTSVNCSQTSKRGLLGISGMDKKGGFLLNTLNIC